MEITNSCCCCLLRPPDKYLKMPYTRLGTTEIYANMLKECFEIHLILHSNDGDGICEVCVGRLRDARDFRLQVQRSQAELLARLQGMLHVKEEHPEKTELSDDDIGPDCREELIHAEVKTEISNDPLPSEEGEFKELMINTAIKNEASETCEQDSPGFARKHHYEQSAKGPDHAKQKSGNICDTLDQDERDTEHGHHSDYTVINTYTCDTCGKQFSRKYGLIRHKRVHVTHICDICNKKFKKKSRLVWHRRVHTGEKPYGCEICKKRYARKGSLVEHKRRVHTVQGFICDVCKKQYRRKESLSKHLRVHMGKKLYHCEFCYVKFLEYKNLKTHIETYHTELYGCDVCKRVFTSKRSLSLHLKTHAKLTFSCDVCSMSLATKNGLRRHQLIHTGEKAYGCEICKKRFRYKEALRKHEYLHTGEKNHCCYVCGKQFARHDYLRTHLKTHVEGKNFPCELCTKSYSTKEGLRQHKRTHTKEKAVVKTVKKRNKKIRSIMPRCQTDTNSADYDQKPDQNQDEKSWQ